MLIDISDTVRIEDGPPRKTARATKELLSDAVTAAHYKEGGIDAEGKKITLGQTMSYIDWKCAVDARVWYLYRKSAEGKFLPISTHDSEDAARAAAAAL